MLIFEFEDLLFDIDTLLGILNADAESPESPSASESSGSEAFLYKSPTVSCTGSAPRLACKQTTSCALLYPTALPASHPGSLGTLSASPLLHFSLGDICPQTTVPRHSSLAESAKSPVSKAFTNVCHHRYTIIRLGTDATFYRAQMIARRSQLLIRRSRDTSFFPRNPSSRATGYYFIPCIPQRSSRPSR